MSKRIVCILLVAVMTLALCACGNGTQEASPSPTVSPTPVATPSTEPSATPAPPAEPANPDMDKLNFTIEMEDGAIIKGELYPEVAPYTVENFQTLISEGFYDGLTFHRIMDGFMIQGGDPLGSGMGGSDKTIVGEFTSNGVENDLSHTRGMISMARNGVDMNSASSQFFIVHADSVFLDGDYAAFGMVTEGMDVVDTIAENTPVTDGNGTVLKENQPVIKSITLD